MTLLLAGQVSLADATAQAREALIAQREEDGASGEASAVPPLDRHRLRRYDPMTARRLDTYTGREASSISALFKSTTAVLLLETRGEREEWSEYDPNELMLRVARWDAEAKEPACGGGMSAMVRVRGGQSDGTVGDLKVRTRLWHSCVVGTRGHPLIASCPNAHAGRVPHGEQVAVSAALGIPLVFQRLVEVSDRHARVLAPEDAKLVGGLGVWPGTDVVVEVVGPGEAETDASSPVVAHYQQSRNAATLV